MDGQRFTLCAPYDFNRLYGAEKYSLQNMLLREVNMPSMVYPGEASYETWDDHAINTFWDNAKAIIESNMSGDAYFAGASEQSFMNWANKVFSELEATEIKLTGAAVIRYTNVMSGYPTLRLTGIVTKDSQSRQYGITESPRRSIDMDGYERVES
jgi:hypothetical protein